MADTRRSDRIAGLAPTFGERLLTAHNTDLDWLTFDRRQRVTVNTRTLENFIRRIVSEQAVSVKYTDADLTPQERGYLRASGSEIRAHKMIPLADLGAAGTLGDLAAAETAIDEVIDDLNALKERLRDAGFMERS